MAIVVPVITNYNAKGINKAIADFKKLDSASAKTGFALRGIDQAATGIVTGLAKAGAAIGAVAGVIGFKLTSAAFESQKVMKATEQIIKTTGGAANITASQVGLLSEKLSEQIGVDDELIQQSANLLLTFKQIQNQAGTNNDIFTQSLTLAQDLGNLFGSASGAAMQLGKALSDPTSGLTALRKAGINFTDSQKAQIKALQESGDLLGAQKIVLEEVRNQVGGLAAATSTDFDRAKVAIGNLAEKFGFLLLPAVEAVARYVSGTMVPFFEKLADVIGRDGLGAGFGFLTSSLLDFFGRLEGGGAKVYFLIAAFLALKLGVLAYSVVTAVATVANLAFAASGVAISLAVAPLALVAFAVVAIGVAVVAAYLKFEKFREVVANVLNACITVNEIFINFFIKGYNILIAGFNKLIDVANFFGAGLPRIAKIGEVSFRRISVAAKTTTGSVTALLSRLQLVKNEERQAMSAKGYDPDPPGGGGGGSPVETAKQKLDKYLDALKKVKDETKGVTEATKSLKDAQNNITKATKAVTDAQIGLADATQAVELAELHLDKIRKGLGVGAKDSLNAADKVTEAQNSLENSGYSLEESVLAVKDAEAELAKLRADSMTPLRDVREAEITLARAKIALTEAQIGQRKSTQELSQAQKEYEEITFGAKEGSDRLKDALNEVEEAKKKQIDANDRLIEAREREIESVDKEKEANQRLLDVKYELIDAQKALADMRKQVGDQIANQAESVFAERQFKEVIKDTGGSGIDFDFGFGKVTPDDLKDIRIPSLEELLGGGFGTFAKGGIVTKPIVGLVGEAGAEAIIPLDRMGSMGSTYNISVTAGMGADGKDIGAQIVNALKRYERTNGALPLTVA